MSSTSAHAQLRLLQHRIYRALELEARAIFGETPVSIRRYKNESDRDLGGPFQISTKAELISKVREVDVTFVADYHTFAQAQRTALRLLREAVLPGEQWALGLELIPSQYQRALDDFQRGKLSLKRFHELIRYQEQWGFPWKNYKPLFDWARENGVRLIALNRPQELVYQNFSHKPDGSGKDLLARDQWAAGIITDLFHAHPNIKMLVLYGGLHVGRAHLPEQLARVSQTFLKKKLRSLSIHQNHERLYWKLARAEHELHAQVLKLKRDVFCVFSGTPWAQLQSLIGSSEGENLEDPGSAEGADETDYLSIMNGYGGVIAEFFGLPQGSFESLSLRSIDDADFVDSLVEIFSEAELRLIRQLIKDNHRVYLPRAQIAYLASPSQNAAAELAAIHLLRQRTRLDSFNEGGREGFFRQVLEAGFGFLGSLVLNPRRKCDLPADHMRRLRALARGEKPAFLHESKARKLALAVLTGKKRGSEAALAKIPRRSGTEAAAGMVAAHFAGQVLAKQLYPVVLAEKHGAADFRAMVALFLSSVDFEKAYFELVSFASTPVKRLHNPSKSDSL